VPWLGVMVDFGYDSMGVNSTALGNLGYGGGNLNVFSVSLDPIVHLTPKTKVDVYLTGGPGYYRQEQQFTQPGVATGFNPFFGFYPYSTNIIVSDYTINKPGLDGVSVSRSGVSGAADFSPRPVTSEFSPVTIILTTFRFRR
jgi:hypothetical protein